MSKLIATVNYQPKASLELRVYSDEGYYPVTLKTSEELEKLVLVASQALNALNYPNGMQPLTIRVSNEA